MKDESGDGNPDMVPQDGMDGQEMMGMDGEDMNGQLPPPETNNEMDHNQEMSD